MTTWQMQERARLEKNIREEATIKGGVIRWNSNGSVPPSECVQIAVELGLPVDVAKCSAAREADLDVFLTNYRAKYRGPSDEERFEARAARGPGVQLVNVITGHRWTT